MLATVVLTSVLLVRYPTLADAVPTHFTLQGARSADNSAAPGGFGRRGHGDMRQPFDAKLRKIPCPGYTVTGNISEYGCTW